MVHVGLLHVACCSQVSEAQIEHLYCCPTAAIVVYLMGGHGTGMVEM